MAKIEEKKPVVAEISEVIKDAESVILVAYSGIDVAADMNGDGEIDLSDAIIIIYKSLGVVQSRRLSTVDPD